MCGGGCACRTAIGWWCSTPAARTAAPSTGRWNILRHRAKIVEKLGLVVLVNCGPAERQIARDIVQQAKRSEVVSLADLDVPLGLSKAIIRRARLLVTTDSGPRYFGVAFGRPVVSLFGPTGIAATRTHYDQERCLSLNLECSPCMERTCPLSHHRCMRDLSVEQVFASVQELLQQPRVAVAA